MAIYELKSEQGEWKLSLKEQLLYGSSRVGVWKANQEVGEADPLNFTPDAVFYPSSPTVTDIDFLPYDPLGYTPPTLPTPIVELKDRNYGEKQYELSNHLGNVHTVVSDRKTPIADNGLLAFYEPDVVSATDYYSFGMLISERTFEPEGYRYGFNGMERAPEISPSGFTTEFRELDTRLGGRWWSKDPIVKPWESPYAGFSNNPIFYIDPSGLDPTNKSVCFICGGENPGGQGGGNGGNSGANAGQQLGSTQNGTEDAPFGLSDIEVISSRTGDMKQRYEDTKLEPADNPWANFSEIVITNFQHQWDGTNWGGERGTSKYSPPGNPDGIIFTVGVNIGHGAVGSQNLAIAITGEGIGSYYVTGGGLGTEGINGGIGVAILLKTDIGFKEYNDDPLPLQDLSGAGVQGNAGLAAIGKVGGTFGYNIDPNTASLKPFTYTAPGLNVGIGIASLPFGTFSTQVTVAVPLLMLDFKNGIYLGKGENQ